MLRTPALVALLASAALVPLTGAAHADPAGTTPRVVFGQDGALVSADATLSPASRVTLAPASGEAEVQDLSTSGDGSRFVEILQGGSGSLDKGTLTTQVVALDAGGRQVRVLDSRTETFTDLSGDAPTFSGSFSYRPALSSTGSTAVWTAFSDDTTGGVLKRAAVASGAAVSIPGSTDLSLPQYLDDSTLLVQDDDGDLVTFPVVGGTTTAITGAPENVVSFTVSADGTEIVYDQAADDASLPDQLFAAPLTHVGGAWTIGAGTQLTTTADGYQSIDDGPGFSRDGSTVYWAQDDPTGTTDDSDIYSVPFAGGTPTDLTNSPDVAETSVTSVGVDSTAPGAPTALPFTLNGTSATIAWTLPSDSDVSGVVVTRGSKQVFVPAPLTSYVDTGLTVGTSYTYDLVAVDRSGNSSVAATRSLTAYQPKLTFFDPTSSGGQNLPFRLTLPQGSYTVQYRTNSTGALATLTQHTGLTYVFSAAHAGYSYGFTIQVSDGFGNSSAVVGAGVTEVPYDQTKATYSGTTLVQKRSDRWLGSATLLQKAGSAARITLNGTRLQIIGERCASCGVMDVYVDGARVAGIDTHAGARQARQVLYTRALTKGNHAIVIKARGTAGRPNVVLDGFGVRH